METVGIASLSPTNIVVFNYFPLTGMETKYRFLVSSRYIFCFQLLTPHGDGNYGDCTPLVRQKPKLVFNHLPLTGMKMSSHSFLVG
jgi:hypothetical protein